MAQLESAASAKYDEGKVGCGRSQDTAVLRFEKVHPCVLGDGPRPQAREICAEMKTLTKKMFDLTSNTSRRDSVIFL